MRSAFLIVLLKRTLLAVAVVGKVLNNNYAALDSIPMNGSNKFKAPNFALSRVSALEV